MTILLCSKIKNEADIRQKGKQNIDRGAYSYERALYSLRKPRMMLLSQSLISLALLKAKVRLFIGSSYIFTGLLKQK